MSPIWQELIKLLGGFAVLVAALAWLTKSLITHFLDKDIEKYKNRLAIESTRELEQFKSQLQIAAKEREVRFSKLHEKRAEIIAELHLLLCKAFLSVNALVLRIKDEYDETTLEQAAKNAHEACSAAFSFFKKNKLYLSKGLSDLIQSILSTMELTSASYLYAGAIRKNALDHWNEQSQKIGLVVSRVEQEFRVTLGSEHEETVELEKKQNRDDLIADGNCVRPIKSPRCGCARR